MKTKRPAACAQILSRLPLCVFLILLTALSLHGAPFHDLPISYTQPGGTVIELRGTGDEFYAVFETLDGYTVLFDQGLKAYCYAQPGSGGQLVSGGVQVHRGNPAALGLATHLREDVAVRRQQVQQRYQRWNEAVHIEQRWKQRKTALQYEAQPARSSGTPQGPRSSPPLNTTTGNRLGLTLLIDFDDDPATVPQSDIDAFCNGDNYTGYGNYGSVKKFFYDNSNGLLLYSNVVTVYIRIPNSLHPKSYYNDTSKDCGDQANLLIRDALDIMKGLPNYTTEILPAFQNLTVDGDNNVLACNVFYAGGNGGVWSFGLWPHSWALFNVGAQSLSPDGKQVFNYQVSNIGSSLTIGTFCHENGHMLCDYPDLYDYTYTSTGVGDWCLMCSGSYGGYPAGSNPSQICGYLKRASGWATTTDLTSSSSLIATVTATAGTNFNHFYRFQKPDVPTEDFLAECRYTTGHDAGLPGSGVLVWHIDELGDNSTVNLSPNTIHSNYEATVVQADNLWSMEKNANYGDANDPFYSGNSAGGYVNQFTDSSYPNAQWWNGVASGLRFTSFSTAARTMTFLVGDAQPTAIFSASPASGPAPLRNVTFSDTSAGVITNRSWDFGDGSTIPSTTATTVQHTYTAKGVYSPSLTVSGPFGTSTTNRLNYILVTDPGANVVALGDNSFGQCSVATAATNTIAIAAGGWHSLALRADGKVLAWGDDWDGQCDVPPGLMVGLAIAAGGYHSLAIRADGTVAAWGGNDLGETNVPAGLADVIAIAAGTWHSMALRRDGTVAVWGDNSWGQAAVPAGLSHVAAVAAGGNHCLTLQTNGLVAAWGENTDAEGGFAGQSVVPWGLTNVVAIAAGEYHSLAVKADGTVVAWGDNSQGQCGVPTGLSNIVAVAAGGAHSVALAPDGTLVAWGASWNGQCALPPTGTNAVSVAAGLYHTLVMLDDGTFVHRLLNPAWKDNQARMLVQTYQSRNYVLEGKNALVAETWTALATNNGNGALKVMTDPGAGWPQRFYRVRQQ